MTKGLFFGILLVEWHLAFLTGVPMFVPFICAFFLTLSSTAVASEPAIPADAAAKKAVFLLQQTAPSDADGGTQTFRAQVTCPTLAFIGTEVLLRLNPSGSQTLVVFATMVGVERQGLDRHFTVTMIDESADGTIDRVDGVDTENRKTYDDSNAFQSVLNCYVATK
ncbi:MAG: hypothetical protein WAZ14_03415 [Patescibacteria group bacterium]